MKNKNFNNKEILKLIVKERVISIAVSFTVTIIISSLSVYGVNKAIKKLAVNGIENINNKIDREAIYRGTINLEKKEVQNQREIASGVRDGFDEYEAYNSSVQSESLGEESNFSSGGSSSLGGNTSNNVAVTDNSSITGRSIRIFEGEAFDPIKSLNLRATDINGENISDKITIIENTVDIYSPGQYIVKAGVPLSSGLLKEITLTINVEPIALNLSVNKFEAISQVANKGEIAALNLEIDSNKGYNTVLSAEINGEYYPVRKIESRDKSQKYMIEIPVGDEGGIIDYNLSTIRMSDNTIIAVNKKTNINVIKDKPSISTFTYEEIEGESKDTSNILIKIRLDDKDNALRSEIAWFYLYDEYNKKVLSKPILPGYETNIDYVAIKNGIYTAKVTADLDIYGKEIRSEEIFRETIEITNIDKSKLTGENTKIKVGDKFDPITDLKIKAIDVDGTDITENVVVEENKVEVNVPGKYLVKILVINKNNEEIRKEFTVEVVDSIITRILRNNIGNNENEEVLTNYFNANNKDDLIYSSNSNIVAGSADETFNADLSIDGIVLKGNGGLPTGRLEVELPTKVAFFVDKDGGFTGSNFEVKNKSGCDVNLIVEQFIEGNPAGGIIINNSINDFTKVGRGTISLQMSGTSKGVTNTTNLDSTVSNKDFIRIEAENSAFIHLYGQAGLGKSEQEDKNGATETFTLRFRIKKA